MKIVRSGLLVLGLSALIWHLLPIAVWRLRLEPELSRKPGASRLQVPFVREFPSAPDSFAKIAYEGISLAAPVQHKSERPCSDQPDVCLEILVGGRMSIHSRPPPESFREMVNLRAPDRDGLSLFRWPLDNWDTIEALRVRVTTSRARLNSWRYYAATSKGVVAELNRDGKPSYVVAAYAPEGPGARVIGVAGLEREVLLQMLGTIHFVE